MGPRWTRLPRAAVVERAAPTAIPRVRSASPEVGGPFLRAELPPPDHGDCLEHPIEILAIELGQQLDEPKALLALRKLRCDLVSPVRSHRGVAARALTGSSGLTLTAGNFPRARVYPAFEKRSASGRSELG
jgi:hypothetical protein